MKARIAPLIALVVLVASCSTGDGRPGATSSTVDPAGETTTSAASDTTTSTTPTSPAPVEYTALKASLDAADPIASARVEGSIAVSGLPADAGVSELTLAFSSAYDTAAGTSSFLMDMSSLADAIEVPDDDPFAGFAADMMGRMEFRQVDDRAYLQFPFLTAMLGADTPWVSMPAQDGELVASDMETVPADPRDVLDAYDGAEATVEVLGEESVNDVTATHYRVVFDTEQLVETLTPAEQAELESSGVFAAGTIPLDLWVAEPGYIVRMVLEVDGSAFAGVEGGEFGSMVVRYDVLDVNRPVTVDVPPADTVTAIEDLEPAFDLGFETPTDG